MVTIGEWLARQATAASHPAGNRRHAAVADDLARNECRVTYDNCNCYSNANSENTCSRRLPGNGASLGRELSIASRSDEKLVPAVHACHGAEHCLGTRTRQQSEGNSAYERFVDGGGSLRGVH